MKNKLFFLVFLFILIMGCNKEQDKKSLTIENNSTKDQFILIKNYRIKSNLIDTYKSVDSSRTIVICSFIKEEGGIVKICEVRFDKDAEYNDALKTLDEKFLK